MDFVPEQTDPSDFLLFAFGKILFSVGDFETLESLSSQYESKSFELWRARMLIRKGENEGIRGYHQQLPLTIIIGAGSDAPFRGIGK